MGKRDYVVREYVQGIMDVDTLSLVSETLGDLYFGPNPPDGTWPGYAAAKRQIEAWAMENLPSTLYVDSFADCASESEPEGWTDCDGTPIEADWEGVLVYERSEIARVVFGKLVTDGGLQV